MLPKKLLLILALAALSLITAACGTVATPRPALEATPAPNTLVPRATTGAGQDVSARPTEVPTQTPTTEPPTATPTEVEPTATSTSTPTSLPPTETPTEIPTTAVPPTATVEEASAADAAGPGDPARGADIFANGAGTAPPCSTCHLVDVDQVQVGPSMMGVASRAGSRVEGLSAEEYIHQSILSPNAFLVPDTDVNVFSVNGQSLMIQNYADLLSAQDINDLVAYLLTLE